MADMYLYGKNSVLERLKVNSASIKKIFLQENLNLAAIEQLIKQHRIPLERLRPAQLERIKKADNLQGIVAKINEYKYVSLEELLGQEKKLTLLFLDRIYDPQNLGAIIRTAACFGNFAVVIPKHKACAVNDTVIHVAQGGENYTPVSMVSNLTNAIISAKKSGYWIMGATVNKNSQELNKISMPFPLGVVFGSEGEGLRYGVDKYVDIRAQIPMALAKLSFNVSIACAIFCYETDRQRGRSEK
jgi:23S rRNA (guanosine2251-2'-O)-methyltransferase